MNWKSTQISSLSYTCLRRSNNSEEYWTVLVIIHFMQEGFFLNCFDTSLKIKMVGLSGDISSSAEAILLHGAVFLGVGRAF